jgi:hypothetical protein
MTKVGIVTPARDQVHTGFAFDAMNMVGFTVHARPDIELGAYTSLGTMIFDQRIKLARQALEEGCDYLLWLDSDIRFPKDALIRLLDHGKDMVGANYVTRQIPPEPVSFVLTADGTKWIRVPTTKESTGLQKVTGTGFGIMMTSAKIIRDLDKNRNMPMFWFQYSTTNHTTLGEDIFFCINAGRHGYEIFIDHDLSKQIHHIGSFEFGHEHVEDESIRAMQHALATEAPTDLNELPEAPRAVAAAD